MTDLRGKKAVLFGKDSGLLAGVVDSLGAAGADVSDVSALVTASDQQGISQQLAALGDFDILVIQPAWREYKPFLETTPADWDAALVQNFERPTYLAQAAAQQLIAQGRGGRIIFLSAVQGIMPFSGAAAFGTTLTMIWAMAKMMAVDLAPHGITVNVVAAGWLDSAEFDGLDSATQTHIRAGVPLARTGSTGDVGGVMAFLVSDAAAYITGTILPVDGGYTLTRVSGKSMLEA